jgi:hypothetical protein
MNLPDFIRYSLKERHLSTECVKTRCLTVNNHEKWDVVRNIVDKIQRNTILYTSYPHKIFYCILMKNGWIMQPWNAIFTYTQPLLLRRINI